MNKLCTNLRKYQNEIDVRQIFKIINFIRYDLILSE